jgi:DNA-binding GntR family transcriptional regulator
VSESDLSEVYHLLSLLESDAAAAVASQASAQDLAELEKLHQQLETAAHSTEDFLAANVQFHARLLVMAGNRWREQIVNDLRKVMKLQRHNSLLKSGRIEASLKEHRDLLAALKARDPALACKHMQAHFKNGYVAASESEGEFQP